MKNTKIKLFTMFLAGVLFSTFAVFAATISVPTNFTTNAVQYLQKLVLTSNSNHTWVILDANDPFKLKVLWNSYFSWDISWKNFVWNTIKGQTWQFTSYCNYNGTVCSTVSNMIWWWWTSLWNQNNSKIYYNTWNVGIGTNNPLRPLHVVGDSKLEWDIDISNGGGVERLIRRDQWTIWYWYLDTEFWLLSNDADDAIAAKYEDRYYYWWRDSLVILNNNVGIGTDTPSSKLDVNGSGRFSSNLNVSWNAILMWNVGIGTNTPSSKLEVVWTGSFSNLMVNGKINVNTLSAWQIQYGNDETIYTKFWSSVWWQPHFTWDLAIKSHRIISTLFKPSENSNMLVIGDGDINSKFVVIKSWWDSSFIISDSNDHNVGIGTDTPYQKLDVNGAIKIWAPTVHTGCDASNAWTMAYLNIDNWSSVAMCMRTKTIPPIGYSWITIMSVSSGAIESEAIFIPNLWWNIGVAP